MYSTCTVQRLNKSTVVLEILCIQEHTYRTKKFKRDYVLLNTKNINFSPT